MKKKRLVVLCFVLAAFATSVLAVGTPWDIDQDGYYEWVGELQYQVDHFAGTNDELKAALGTSCNDYIGGINNINYLAYPATSYRPFEYVYCYWPSAYSIFYMGTNFTGTQNNPFWGVEIHSNKTVVQGGSVQFNTQFRNLGNVILPTCGDNIVNQASEECDSNLGVNCTAAYGQTCEYCETDCTTTTITGSVCGDGIVDSNDGETCDDGNTNDNDGCNSNCIIEWLPAKCEDGYRLRWDIRNGCVCVPI